MTPGERMVWAAVYAATWSRLRAVHVGPGFPMAMAQIAVECIFEADMAVTELARLANGGYTSAVDVINGDKP